LAAGLCLDLLRELMRSPRLPSCIEGHTSKRKERECTGREGRDTEVERGGKWRKGRGGENLPPLNFPSGYATDYSKMNGGCFFMSQCRYNMKCLHSEGLFKVTCSHIHCEHGNVSDMVQNHYRPLVGSGIWPTYGITLFLKTLSHILGHSFQMLCFVQLCGTWALPHLVHSLFAIISEMCSCTGTETEARLLTFRLIHTMSPLGRRALDNCLPWVSL